MEHEQVLGVEDLAPRALVAGEEQDAESGGRCGERVAHRAAIMEAVAAFARDGGPVLGMIPIRPEPPRRQA